MLFQSVGSNYSADDCLNALFGQASKDTKDKLSSQLNHLLGGQKTILYSKGRAALATAISLASHEKPVSVFITGFTCYSVEQAVLKANCKPVYVDIDENNLNISLADLKNKIKKHSDAKIIIVQNTLGLPTDITAIEQFAKDNGLTIIEDLAHCFGCKYGDGRLMGTVGDLAMISFGKGKSVDAINGGALIVRDEKYLTSNLEKYYPIKSRRLIDSWRDRFYPLMTLISRKTYASGFGKVNLFLAYKLKLAIRSADGEVNQQEAITNWQAKIISKKITNLTKIIQLRRDNTKYLVERLKQPVIKALKDDRVAALRIPLIVNHRQDLINKFIQAGLMLDDTWYYPAVSPSRFYDKSSFSEHDCPVSAKISKNLINLPTHINLSDYDVAVIIQIINEVEG